MSGEGLSKFSDYLSSVEEIVEEIRNGRMVILADDEDRENEGDLVIAAQMATPESINFMAKYGRGLICLAMTSERVNNLAIPMMSAQNGTVHKTAFTVSIEAKEGVTTGISAADRARTISVAIDPTKGKDDIVTPGHIFPLMARDGGVLVRAGHTEAAVDFARLSGLIPAGVICEIMNDDGTMARMPDLVKFAQFHHLKIGTIADLIAYRLRYDRLVSCMVETPFFHSHFGGDWRLKVYRTKVGGMEHCALIKGDISNVEEPVLVRMHAVNPLEDVLGEVTGHENQLHKAMEMIGAEGRGVVVMLADAKQLSLSNQVRRKLGEKIDMGTQLRDYGVGAQILMDVGVKKMVLLSNTKRNVVGLDGFGLQIVGQKEIPNG